MKLNRRRIIASLPGLCLLGGLPAAAWAQKKPGPGVTDAEIKIGNTNPYSGPASAYGTIGKVEAAYIRKINDEGGVNGRKIDFITLDDGYSPPKTIELTRRLVEQEQVLAIASPFGTAPNSATHRYLNAKKVPQLFPNSGASKWNDPKRFPWTVAFLPSYQAEMKVYAKHLLQTKPNAKVAILYQNDDLGKDYLKGFKEGLGDKAKTMIVAEATYEVTDPTVDSQMVQLKASGADTLIHMSQVRFAAQALRKLHELKWNPTQYMAYPGASLGATFRPIGMEKATGVISMGYYKEPGDPAIANDADYKEYLAFMKKYYPEGDSANGANVTGYVHAQSLIAVLKACGNDLTRENVMRRATSLKDVPIGMLLPGITLNTDAEHFCAIGKMRLRRFNGTGWDYLGEAVSLR